MDGENQMPDEGCDSESQQNGLVKNSLQDIQMKNNGDENEDVFEDIQDANAAPQLIISQLKNELKKSHAEIEQLKAKITDDESKTNLEKYQNIINQRNDLLKMLSHKDNTIERMSSDIVMLETQLKAAESAKFDALTRLDAVEGQELTLLFQKNRKEMMKEHPELLMENHKMKNGTLGQREAGERQEVSENTTSRNSCGIRSGKRARKVTPTGQSTDDNHLTNIDLGSASSKCHQEEDNLTNRHENKDDSNSSNIQLELLSEVRTRRQNRFIFDAFNRSTNTSVNEELITRNGKKVPVQEKSNSSGKTPNRGRPRNGCVVKLSKIKFAN